MKGATSPIILDLTHSFRPELARPFAPGSEVVPLIEVMTPDTGRHGGLRADLDEKIHRVIGVSTPIDVLSEYGSPPARLPVMSECPDGMGEQYVDDAAAYPIVRRGETVVYDPSQREPTHGALCVLEWSNGNRAVLLTNKRQSRGQGAEQWFADTVNRPANRKGLERQHVPGAVGMLYTSDGPYSEDRLREKIVGTVIGILVPHRRQAGVC